MLRSDIFGWLIILITLCNVDHVRDCVPCAISGRNAPGFQRSIGKCQEAAMLIMRIFFRDKNPSQKLGTYETILPFFLNENPLYLFLIKICPIFSTYINTRHNNAKSPKISSGYKDNVCGEESNMYLYRFLRYEKQLAWAAEL